MSWTLVSLPLSLQDKAGWKMKRDAVFFILVEEMARGKTWYGSLIGRQRGVSGLWIWNETRGDSENDALNSHKHRESHDLHYWCFSQYTHTDIESNGDTYETASEWLQLCLVIGFQFRWNSGTMSSVGMPVVVRIYTWYTLVVDQPCQCNGSSFKVVSRHLRPHRDVNLAHKLLAHKICNL